MSFRLDWKSRGCLALVLLAVSPLLIIGPCALGGVVLREVTSGPLVPLVVGAVAVQVAVALVAIVLAARRILRR
jgi:hypothetical protein